MLGKVRNGSRILPLVLIVLWPWRLAGTVPGTTKKIRALLPSPRILVIAAARVRSFTFHITPSAGPPASAGPPGTGSTSTGERRPATPDTLSLAAARPRPRERHARIISADGEYQASKKLAQAAAVMAAMQLRLLQTVADKNSTLAIPVPAELLRFFDRAAPPPSQAEPQPPTPQDTPAPPLPVPEIPAFPVQASAAVTAPLNAAPKNTSSRRDAAPIGGPCQHAGGRCGSAMPDAVVKLLMQFSSAGMVLSRLQEE